MRHLGRSREVQQPGAGSRSQIPHHSDSGQTAMGITKRFSAPPATAKSGRYATPEDDELRSTASTMMSSMHARSNQLEEDTHARSRVESSSSTSYTSHKYGGSSSNESDGQRCGTVRPLLRKGYLIVKKGLLKGYEKRFYFILHGSPELYSFKDEIAFDNWMTMGQPVTVVPGCPPPSVVCTVLRADRSGDASSTSDRTIAIMAGDSSKFTSRKFLTQTPAECEDWIQALHQIQMKRRDGHSKDPVVRPAHDTSVTVQQRPHTNTSATARVPSGRSRAPSLARDDDQSVGSSKESDHSDAHTQHSGHSRWNSRAQEHAAPTNPGNVVLFVPAAGSAIATSNTKLARAKQEMDELLRRGAKRPDRGGMESSREIKWRFGVPDYALADLAYMKGATRDHDATPLESYIESCCQTFMMEATHKSDYTQWVSVRQDYFHLQVNDGDNIPGASIKENDMFGMMYLNDLDVDLDCKEGEERDPRAILTEALPDGFPMEVLQVFTQPPQCYFSWRQWGSFSGRYKGVRGDGSTIEVRGFGQLHVDSNRILHLRLFYKQKDLFDQLDAAATRLRVNEPAPMARPAASSSAKTPSQQPAVHSKGDALEDFADFTL